MKKMFLALLTTLLLLLAATTALAVSPSDYNCPVCGEPCTEWYSYHSGDGTVSVHSPYCSSCSVIAKAAESPCTPVEGTATCMDAARCSVCGSPDWIGSAPDPNAHGDMSRWLYASPTQHSRYCLDCGANDEYEDHYGGTATCSKRAICEGCGGSYGELSTEHAMSEWESISTTQHRKHCTLCWAVETIIYEDHYGGTATCWELAVCEGCGEPYGDYDFDNHDWGDWEGFSSSTHIRVCHDCDAEEEAPHTGGDGSCLPICEVCGWNYLDNDGKHGEMSEWWYTNGTQHYRHCLVCGRGEEYAPHSGGTATCVRQAVCEDCDERYGEPDSTRHGDYTDWAYHSDTQHRRICIACGSYYEYEDHYGGTATCVEQAVCEGCGDGYGERSNNHTISEWKNASFTQHRKYCVLCWSPETISYEDHYGGTATCTERAICEGCGEGYGKLAADAHSWGEWTPNADGTHTRVCTLDPTHTETADCTWGTWTHLTHIHHERRCTVCNGQELGEHTGGTLTCYSPRICDVCNEGYGSPDNSGLSGHPNPVIEQKAPTCYEEGYYRVTCDHPGCSAPFTEFIFPTIGQHLYSNWQPADDGSHISPCLVCGEEHIVSCTVFRTLEGLTPAFAACPICGVYDGGVLAVVYAHDGDESLPYGTLVIRGGEAPADGVLYAITVTGSYYGKVVELMQPVTVTVPMALEGFRIVSMDGADIPFTPADGMLTFEAEAVGLFLLIPAE